MVAPPGPSCAVAGPSTLTSLAARSRVTIAASPGPTTVGLTDTIFGVVAVAKLTVTVCSLSPPEEEGDEEPVFEGNRAWSVRFGSGIHISIIVV